MADFVSGKDLVSRVSFNNQPWVIKVKSAEVQEMGEVVIDHVNGEKRGRGQKITDGFEVTLQCYEDGNSSILQNYIANQQNEDASLPQLPHQAGLRFDFLDGTSGAWVFAGQMTLHPMHMQASGRKERVMHTVKFFVPRFTQVPTSAGRVTQ